MLEALLWAIGWTLAVAAIGFAVNKLIDADDHFLAALFCAMGIFLAPLVYAVTVTAPKS